MASERMRVVVVTVAIIAAAALPLYAAADEEVKQAEIEWARALVAGNVAALDAMFSEDLMYVHSSGGIDTKQKFLESIRTGSLRFNAVTPVTVRVRSYGNVGVVNGLYDLELGSRSGAVTKMRIQYLNVYVKDGGRWRIVTQQTTRLPERS